MCTCVWGGVWMGVRVCGSVCVSGVLQVPGGVCSGSRGEQELPLLAAAVAAVVIAGAACCPAPLLLCSALLLLLL